MFVENISFYSYHKKPCCMKVKEFSDYSDSDKKDFWKAVSADGANMFITRLRDTAQNCI